MEKEISKLRRNYTKDQLDIHSIDASPFVQFKNWFQQALDSQELEPNAFVLSTVNQSSEPSSRVVLLKGLEENKFVFYTNYSSQKAIEIQSNPKVAMLFSWLSQERQIRIRGTVSKVDKKTSEAYFHSRPKESQIGAWVSNQSNTISSREALEQKQLELEKQYADADKLPLPPFWGGYQIEANHFEFWQGRASRLHDRLAYQLVNNSWDVVRLAP